MPKRDRLAEIERRWRRRMVCSRELSIWPQAVEMDRNINDAYQEACDIDDHYKDDISYLLRRLAKAERMEKKP